MYLTILFACRTFPLLFPRVSSASTDKRPSVTWPCLPAYSSSFILTLPALQSLGSIQAKILSNLRKCHFLLSQVLGIFFFLVCFLSLKNCLSLHSPDFSVNPSDQFPFPGGGGGCFTGTSQTQFKCCSQLLPYDPNTPRGGTYQLMLQFFF